MIKAGDIIFVKNKSFISDIITWFDAGRFSHVAIAISNTHVIEAQYFTKARISPFYYGQDEYVVMDLNLTDGEVKKVVDVALTMTGKWYDYPQIAGYIFKKILKLESKNLFNNPNNWICSELVYYMLVEINKIQPNEHLKNLTPNQLYNFLQNLCISQNEHCHEFDSEIHKTPQDLT